MRNKPRQSLKLFRAALLSDEPSGSLHSAPPSAPATSEGEARAAEPHAELGTPSTDQVLFRQWLKICRKSSRC